MIKKEVSNIRLVNAIYEPIRGNMTLLEAWGFYLFDKEFEREPELRNRLMVIYLVGVLDLLDAEMRILPPLIEQAKAEGRDILAMNGEQMLNFCRVTAKMLSEFDEQEQVFMQNLRNQWVHAFMNGALQNDVKCKVVKDGKIQQKVYKHREYHDLIRPCFDRGPLDETLTELRERAVNSWPVYWEGLNFLRANKEMIYDAFRQDQLFVIIPPEV